MSDKTLYKALKISILVLVVACIGTLLHMVYAFIVINQ